MIMNCPEDYAKMQNTDPNLSDGNNCALNDQTMRHIQGIPPAKGRCRHTACRIIKGRDGSFNYHVRIFQVLVNFQEKR